MWFYWIGVTVPPLIVGTWFWFQGGALGDFKTYGSPEWLTLMGTVLSYVGFATSVYAVIRIAELTRRSFARERLPDLLKSLATIGDQLAVFTGTAADLQTERFLGAIPALARSLQRVRDKDISRLAKEVLGAQRKLIKWSSVADNRTLLVVNEARYWAIANLLNEISVELDERIKEERAAR